MAEMVCGRNVLWPNWSVDEMSLKHPDHLYHIFTYMYTCVIVCKCVPHAQDTYQLKMSIQSMSMII